LISCPWMNVNQIRPGQPTWGFPLRFVDPTFIVGNITVTTFGGARGGSFHAATYFPFKSADLNRGSRGWQIK
jgi:hypothetical protein